MATDYSKLKVVDLKAELKRLGLPQNGLKAELVARLEAAAAGPDESAAEEQSLAADAADGDAVAPVIGKDAPASNDHEATGTAQPDASVETEAAPLQETETALPPSDANESTASKEGPALVEDKTQASLVASSSDPAPLQTAEAERDVQKRKRRSTTPPPAADEVAPKRQRQDDDDDENQDGPAMTGATETPTAPQTAARTAGEEEEVQEQVVDAGVGGSKDEVPAAQKLEPEKLQEQEEQEEQGNDGKDERDRAGEAKTTDLGDLGADPTTETLNGQQNMDTATRSRSRSRSRSTRSTRSYSDAREGNNSTNNIEPRKSPAILERNVEPSLHPATAALYIKNFMRPLRPQAVRDHLLDLATPAGAPLEDSTIVDFYLDTIRTHAFAVFSSVSAASRVRTALHDRVWPDETNRKALWIDFVPPEFFNDWVNMEQAGGRRGSAGRFEVAYEEDKEGKMTVKLEESNPAAASSNKPGPTQPAAGPERRPSIPSGPLRGIENAPTGPRGYQGTQGAFMHPSRMDATDQTPAQRTRGVNESRSRAQPSISWVPVSKELAERRLEALRAAKSKDAHQEGGKKDYHRYFFEQGDVLVDRGPEIFLGIRPPHRERERRREMARGGGGGGGPLPRGPRGPPGGRNRRGPPHYSSFAPHGVPRGGDRFRPQGSPAYNDRPRYGGGGGYGGGYGGGGGRRDRDRNGYRPY
ncbi:hypothetical protein F4780DRAFT_732985 [Xylariomycetidae sp. FL0641]|nr:hypothetical protein F4780DRAFT_732985 [Xylariomycetidae sp. FL0641]